MLINKWQTKQLTRIKNNNIAMAQNIIQMHGPCIKSATTAV